MASRVINKEIEQVAIDLLKHHPRNANNGDVEAIKKSLAVNGWYGSVVANLSTKHILAGNHRVMAAKDLGWETVPVQWVDVTPEEELRILVVDNRTTRIGQDDTTKITDILAELANTPIGLEGTGYGAADLDALIDELAGMTEPAELLTDPDEVPEEVETRCKPGDLWILGRHRLLCGDSTKADDVARLMDGSLADLCFTSPPYALGKSIGLSGNKNMSLKGNAYTNHQDNSEGWNALMRDWFAQSNYSVSDVWVINVQPLAGNKRDLVKFIADNSDRLVDIVTWDKGHAAPQIAQGVMASRYEWMIVFSSTTGASRCIPLSSWQGTVQSVYNAPPQRNNEYSDIHAATMPQHVPMWVMNTLCDKSTSVYEPFCGTGTTLIAAEQLGRKCYGMEISPKYCDVIIQRWENATGQKAVLDGR